MKRKFTVVPVLGMSKDIRTLRREIERDGENVCIHLLKLGMYPDHLSADHWTQEVYTFFNHIQRVKGKNKFPSASFIFDNTWNSFSDCVEMWASGLQFDYGLSGVDVSDISFKIEQYFEWLAISLSSRGSVPRDSVYQKLKELGL